MSAMSNRTVLVDNNTWNNTHIATVGRALASSEEKAYPIMEVRDHTATSQEARVLWVTWRKLTVGSFCAVDTEHLTSIRWHEASTCEKKGTFLRS